MINELIDQIFRHRDLSNIEYKELIKRILEAAIQNRDSIILDNKSYRKVIGNFEICVGKSILEKGKNRVEFSFSLSKENNFIEQGENFIFPQTSYQILDENKLIALEKVVELFKKHLISIIDA